MFSGRASTGGVWYSGTDFPAEYRNTYFHADSATGWIRRFVLDANNRVQAVLPFDDAAGPVVQMSTNPIDGGLYVVLANGGVKRVLYNAGNLPPTAVASASRNYGAAPLTVQFDASGSRDPEALPLTYQWAFGDGTPVSTQVNPSHTFAGRGGPSAYTVTLAATDQGGLVGTDAIRVSVDNTPPTVHIVTPADGTRYPLTGQTLFNLTAALSDAESASSQLACAWQTTLHHNDHVHAGPIDRRCVTTTTVDPLGCGSESFFYHIALTVTDPAGLSGYDEVILRPNCAVSLIANAGSDRVVTDSNGNGVEGIALDGSQSTDPAHAILSYAWYDDGKLIATGASPQVALPLGHHGIRLDVVNDAGNLASDVMNVQVNAPGAPPAASLGRSRLVGTAALTATVNMQGNWWNAGWGARRDLTFNTSGITEAQVDFPVLVKLTPSNFDYTQVQANGADLRFIDADGVTVLSYEIATFNVGGESLIWVKVPRIEPNSTTDSMTMYWNNPTAADGQNRAGVWSNGYAGVWHFDGTLNDSTSNANHGVNQGTTAVPGYLGGARSFNGTSSYIGVVNAASLALANTLTLEAWVKPLADVIDGARIIDKKNLWNDTAGFEFEYKGAPNQLSSGAGGGSYGRGIVELDDGAWHYVATTYNGVVAQVYADGTNVTTLSAITPVVAGTVPLSIGRRSGGGDYFNGLIDEVRISNVRRSDAWIATQRRSMDGSLVTFGAGVGNARPTVSLGAPVNGAVFAYNVSSIALVANAADSDGNVVRVDFYADGGLIGSAATAPYGMTWVGPPVGAHTVTAVAVDNGNASTISTPVNITISAAPTVTLTAPLQGASMFGPNITANYTLIGSGYDHVRLLLDGVGVAIANPPGSYTFTNVAPGGHTVVAQLEDAQNAVLPYAGATATVSVTVLVPPTVSLSAPANGGVFAYTVSSIALAANAADSDGNVVRVDFYADGGLIGSVASAPYAMTWMAPPVGAHSLTAVAVDNRNASTVSTPVNIAINAAPTVTLTAPLPGASVSGPNIVVNYAITGAPVPEPQSSMLLASNALRQQGRWFAYKNAPRYLVGGDTQAIHADPTWFDYTALLDKFAAYRINKVRIFIDPTTDLRSVRRPYAYNSGTQQYDLDTWDSTYWSTTKDFLDKALARNVIVEINMSSLYPGCTSVWNNAGPSGLDRPIQYNKANNSNNAFTSNANSNFSPEWFDPTYAETSSSGRTVFDYQKRLYDKVLAELGTYPNVYFEIHNEPYNCGSSVSLVTAYLRYWAAYLRANTTRPVSVEADDSARSTNYSNLWNDASANVLNSHFSSVDPGEISADMHAAQLKGKLFETNESGTYDFYVRPSNWWLTPSTQWALDGAGLNQTTKQMWGLFLSGSQLGWYNLHQNIADWDRVGTRIKVLRDLVDTLANLGAMSPVDSAGNEYDSLVSAGPSGSNHQVLANPGSEYVVYFWGTSPETAVTAVNMTLSPAGSYNYKFYDPRDGTLISTGNVTSGGGATTIPSPAEGSWSRNAGLALFVSNNTGSGYDHVRLLLDGVGVAIVNPTGSYTFTNVVQGGHTVVAQLEDAQNVVLANAGATATVSVTMLAPPINQPPSVNVGADQTLAVGQTLDLQAAVVDDGWPSPPGAVTLQWTSQSGPATPTWPLNDANQAHTHVVFPTAGTYVLRLTANDGQVTGFDELSVTVTTPNVPPTVSLSAPANGAVFAYTVSSIALAASAADSDGNVVRVDFYADGALIGSDATAPYAMTWVAPSIGAHSLTAVAVDNRNASTISTPVNITISAAPTVTLTAPLQGASVSGPNVAVKYTLIGSGYDHVRLLLDGVGVAIANPTGSYTFNDVVPGGHTVVAQLEDAQNAVLAGATATVGFNVLAPPINQPPSVNVGVDQTLAVGQTLDLQAAVVDDGWPNPPGAVTLQWTSQSGPATPTWPLNDVNQAHTHVVFPTAGTYVLRLTANDGQYTSFDELTITVTAANVAPVVSFTRSPLVGPAPLTVAVNGTGSSDSDGTIVGYAWTFGDGGTASGVTASHVYTTVGTYTITLTVTDNSGATASTTATMNVQDNWWNAAWGARRELTFDTTGTTEAQLDFPVLVKLTPSNFDYTQVQANGADLRFIDADGVTVLSHEIATFNVGGESLIWVKVPRIEPNSTTDSITMYWNNPTAPDGQDPSGVFSNRGLVAAVLPGSRSVQIGTTATAFATIINAGAVVAKDCFIAPATAFTGQFQYQTTDPATNTPTGSPDKPTDIPAGVAQTFVLALRPTAAMDADVAFTFRCQDAASATMLPGINTLWLASSSHSAPDIVALAATAQNDGIVHLDPGTGTGAFSIASINLGVTGSIQVSADTNGAALPMSLALCRTDPVTGVCLDPAIPTTDALTLSFAEGATPTFSVFASASAVVNQDPAAHRIFVRFRDAAGVNRGSTSVAVERPRSRYANWSLANAAPQSVGMTDSAVTAVLDHVFTDRAVQGALLVKAGYVVGERYAEGLQRLRPWYELVGREEFLCGGRWRCACRWQHSLAG